MFDSLMASGTSFFEEVLVIPPPSSLTQLLFLYDSLKLVEVPKYLPLVSQAWFAVTGGVATYKYI